MGYLKLRRSWVILASFVACSLLVVAFPAVDLAVSRMFFHEGFQPRWWAELLHAGIGYFLGVSMLSVVAIYIYNRQRKRHVLDVDGRKVAYLLLVLIVGGGLIVNVSLKGNFGRPRPRDVTEFGGSKQFTPPFVVSRECSRNCSFSSGDGAAGFFSLALAMALSRRRAVFGAALAFGILVSAARIAAGAHFLSDTLVSFFVMLLVSDFFYYYVITSAAGPPRPGQPTDESERALAAAPPEPATRIPRDA
jgi:lipid A 4'-phosphatase